MICINSIRMDFSLHIAWCDIALRNICYRLFVLQEQSTFQAKHINDIMKRKFKQWWSSIPTISTKWTITSYFNWIHWRLKHHNMWCPDGLGQAQTCGGVNPNCLILITGSHMAIHILSLICSAIMDFSEQ
jgi:hypothetical protein